MLINLILILTGKIISKFSKAFNVGSGSTWPGHIALSLNKNFIKNILKKNKVKIVLIAGTNGKTTTARLIKTILEKNGKRVFQNGSGANLLNGIASSVLLHSNILCKLYYDYAIFEMDENSFPPILNEITPDYIILLNLFRDQLDRYGEVNTIARKWHNALQNLNKNITLILNADDPQIASIGLFFNKPQTFYFGLNDKTLTQTKPQHAADSTYCPKCATKLNYDVIYFSHLGIWKCNNCKLKRPNIEDLKSQTYPLSGIYNRYNTNAAILFAQINNINNEAIEQSLKNFTPAFGRQEIIVINNKKVQIFLSKNPTSFNQSLQTIKQLGAKNVLFVLNDRIPDGQDISWIWDVDFEEYLASFSNIIVSGDRTYDMALRIKYAQKIQNKNLDIKNSFRISNFKFQIEENLKTAVNVSLEKTPKTETLYILPTYSAMLEVRKILTGKKIL